MNASRTIAAATLALAASLSPAHAAGTLELHWVQPDRYSDAGLGGPERDRTLAALGAHLRKLVTRLPDGQTLQLEVLDLHLAGEREPALRQDVRVLRGRADWPRITLRYALLTQGRTLKSGEAQLADMDYLTHPRPGELVYEKQLLDRWFESTITAP
jgi:hypothetical protein